MTNDKTERKFTRTWGRFSHKGTAKRAASKAKRQLAKKDIASREAA